jgi:hypothetical protein
MNPAHVHLIVNHLPVVGALFTILLLGFAFIRKGGEVQKAVLMMAVVVSLSLLPAYFTGEPAEERVESIAGVDKALMEQHEDAATVSAGLLGGAGVIALVGLIFYRRKELVPVGFMSGFAVVMVLSAVSLGWTANLGGKIRHSETRGSNAATQQQADHELRD